jgi:hypothetical protein
MRHASLRLVIGFLFCLAIGAGTAQADSVPGQMGDAQGQPEMFGTWTVTKVLCANCQGEATPEVGSKLMIAKSAFQDPFSVSCSTAVSYPNRPLDWKDAQAMFALPQSARGFAPAGGRVLDTRLDCGGGPVARVFFLGGGRAIYLSEAEDYLIVRASKP